MFPVCIIIAYFVAASFAEDLPILGVVGGDVAIPGQFPFQVSIEVNGVHDFGGTLISKDTIITAAHCINRRDPNLITVLAGTNVRRWGGFRLPLASYRVHELFDPLPPGAYDIAIVIVKGSFKFSKYIAPARLPQQNEKIPVNAVATVSGWGASFENGPLQSKLKFVDVPLWNQTSCEQAVRFLSNATLCGGDIDGKHNSCPGDSGGPLTIGDELVGLVSYGYGCGIDNRPVLYTYVAGFREWIKTHTGL